MPPAKRSSSTARTSSASKPAASKPAAKSATPAAKATATTARKSAAKSSTQAKSGATKTANAARAGIKETAAAAKAGAKGTATTAKAGAKETKTRAKAANTQRTNASAASETVTLSRAGVQEALDDAASRGRITRKDANDLVAEIMRRGRHTGDEVAELVGKGRAQLESATKKVRKAEPVDLLVRGADRARRAAGVGPTFPIIGYDDLNVGQVQTRIRDLSRTEQRKVLNYERKHANRKSVVGALEKSLS
jgi:polyhydroxyalkanoate synthesis regulator phasin